MHRSVSSVVYVCLCVYSCILSLLPKMESRQNKNDNTYAKVKQKTKETKERERRKRKGRERERVLCDFPPPGCLNASIYMFLFVYVCVYFHVMYVFICDR